MQQLIKDHNKRTKILYRIIADKMLQSKEITHSRLKASASTSQNFHRGDEIYTKMVNKRLTKDKPKYEKATNTGIPEKHVAPICIRGRNITVPVRNNKRPNKIHTVLNCIMHNNMQDDDDP